MSMSMSMMMNAYVPPAIPDTWTTGASMNTARYAGGLSAYSGKLYYMSGDDSLASRNVFEIYDISLDSWITKSPIPNARTWLMQSPLVGDRIYVCGGTLTTMDIYDISTDSWSTGTSMPGLYGGMNGMSSVAVGTKIYYQGGSAVFGVLHGDLYIYDTVSDTWSMGASGSALWATASCAVGTDIYIFGGQNNLTGPPSSVVSTQIYDTLLNTWSAGSNVPAWRIGATASSVGTKIYLLGGGDYTNFEYDTVSDTWLSKTTMPTAVVFSPSIEYGGKIYLIGTATNQIYTP